MNKDFYKSMGLDISEVKMPRVISSTPMGTFLTCPRKYLFSYLLGLTGQHRSRALDFGSVVHVGLEYWYRTYDLNAAFDAMAALWSDSVADGMNEPGDHRTLSVAQELLRTYLNDPGSPESVKPLVPVKLKTGPAIEQKIIWDVLGSNDLLDESEMEDWLSGDGTEPAYIANLDMLIQREDGIWVCDHKTTSQMGVTWANQWHPSMQMLGYACAADRLLESLGSEDRVQGVLINGLKVSKSIIAKDGTLAPVVKTAETSKSNVEFQRIPIAMTSEQKNEFRLNLSAWVGELRRAVRELQFPANWTSCGDYGGCGYKDICGASMSSRHRILLNNYTEEEPWNPLTR